MSIFKQLAQRRDVASLWDLLQATRNLRCVEPRDKVYALLGIAHAGQKDIVPDYDTPLSTLLNKVLSNEHELRPPENLEHATSQCRELLAMVGQKESELFSPQSYECQAQHSSDSNAARHWLGREGNPMTLWWASFHSHRKIIDLLFSEGVVDEDAQLSLAASTGNKVVTKLLLETRRFRADLEDRNGESPLYCAARSGHKAVVQLLLDTGKVDIESKDRDGQTLLARAARSANEAAVKLLIDTGKVDVESKDRNGRTPLFWAARSGNEAVVKLLLDTGKVDVDSKD
ncbi:hypothetical protein LTR22_024106 [Elasticomyces elasticus]|nr:hypothetical protein LTR22_024106 [Elasticomyces elasticus]